MIKTKSTKPPRGTIFVDSAALMSLFLTNREATNTPVPGYEGGHLFDMLITLGQQGYRVRIAEEVAEEIAQSLLVDGRLNHLDKYFEGNPNHGPHQSNFKKLQDPFIPFFKDIAAGKHPNIEIIPAVKLPDKAGEYIPALKEVIRASHKEREEVTRGEIARITQNRPPHLGRQALEQNLAQFVEKEPEAPIIIFSNDGGMLERFQQTLKGHPNATLVNVRGFLAAMTNSGMSEKTGLPRHSKVHAIIDATCKKQSILGRNSKTSSSFIDTFVDPDSDDHPLNDQPFNRAMNTLVKEIRANRENKSRINGHATPPPTNGSSTAMQRWKAREAARKAIQQEQGGR